MHKVTNKIKRFIMKFTYNSRKIKHKKALKERIKLMKVYKEVIHTPHVPYVHPETLHKHFTPLHIPSYESYAGSKPAHDKPYERNNSSSDLLTTVLAIELMEDISRDSFNNSNYDYDYGSSCSSSVDSISSYDSSSYDSSSISCGDW